jgi:hypothetical protein
VLSLIPRFNALSIQLPLYLLSLTPSFQLGEALCRTHPNRFTRIFHKGSQFWL